jgi:DNA-binding NtrC family response regulator
MSTTTISSVELVKILYIEPLDDLHWHTSVLEQITKPLRTEGYIVDFTVCRDHLFALEQLNRTDYDIFLVHDDASPLDSSQFSHTVRSLGMATPVVLVQEQNNPPPANMTPYFVDCVVKPVNKKVICDVILKVLYDTKQAKMIADQLLQKSGNEGDIIVE